MKLFLNPSERIISNRMDDSLQKEFPREVSSPDDVVIDNLGSWDCTYFGWHLHSQNEATWRIRVTGEHIQCEENDQLRISLVVDDGVLFFLKLINGGLPIGNSSIWQETGVCEECTDAFDSLTFEAIEIEDSGGSTKEDHFFGLYWILYASDRDLYADRIERLGCYVKDGAVFSLEQDLRTLQQIILENTSFSSNRHSYSVEFLR